MHFIIESSYRQAVYINEATKKPVFCTENSIMYDGGFKHKIKREFVPRKLSRLRRCVRKVPFLKKLYHKIIDATKDIPAVNKYLR